MTFYHQFTVSEAPRHLEKPERAWPSDFPGSQGSLGLQVRIDLLVLKGEWGSEYKNHSMGYIYIYGWFVRVLLGTLLRSPLSTSKSTCRCVFGVQVLSPRLFLLPWMMPESGALNPWSPWCQVLLLLHLRATALPQEQPYHKSSILFGFRFQSSLSLPTFIEEVRQNELALPGRVGCEPSPSPLSCH